jgi:exosome complex component RRP42
MTVIPLLKKDYVTKLAEEGKRVDGRRFDEYRPISIETGIVNKAEGSARVKIGNTQVVVGIKMDLGEPFPDTPDCGVLSTAAELIPLASPDFEAGPPQRDAIELARVVDRGVRESEVVDIHKLVLTPGEKVWIVFIDIHIIDYDGNLFDAASLGALAALLTTKIPIMRFMESGELERKDLEAWYERTKAEEIQEVLRHPDLEEIIAKKKKGALKDVRLPMTEPPISCTAVKISNFVFFDPSLDEEELADARLTVATDANGDIRAMQKGLIGSFTKDEVQGVIQGALINGRTIREKLTESVR